MRTIAQYNMYIHNMVFRFFYAFILVLPVFSQTVSNGIPFRNDGFTRASMTQKESSLSVPSGFSMQQSYSMSFSSSSLGSQSAGLYLNTLRYDFSFPLTLSMDFGAWNLFSSSVSQEFVAKDELNHPKWVLPRIGLEYRPFENLTLGIQFVNTRDASLAYSSPFARRSPFSAGW